MSDHFLVVTGGPGAGKTSLITELADLARELRRDTANLCRELDKNGVEPLIFNGENRIIFRRRDVVGNN